MRPPMSATRRRRAESLLLDMCVFMDLGVPVTAADGSVVIPGTVAYTGRCKVQTYEPYERTPEAGGAVSSVQRYSVHVPVGAFSPQVGQVVVMTVTAFDPNLVGRQYRVQGLLHKSAATAYRLLVDEYVGETIVWDGSA